MGEWVGTDWVDNGGGQCSRERKSNRRRTHTQDLGPCVCLCSRLRILGRGVAGRGRPVKLFTSPVSLSLNLASAAYLIHSVSK